MKEIWVKYAAKFDALPDRERISVFAALLLLVVYIVFAIAVEPAQRRSQALRTQIVQQTAEMDAIRAHGQQTRKEADPDLANRARGEELKRKLDGLDETLKAMQRDLVSADRMSALLQEMLASDPGLQLVALRTLPVAPLISGAEQPTGTGGTSAAHTPKAVTGGANVYKRGVEITVRGGYANLHAYLTRLERSSWRMFWWRAQLKVEDDAGLTMSITIYTLSLDKAWLQV